MYSSVFAAAAAAVVLSRAQVVLGQVPPQAQLIDQRSFNNLPSVPPPAVFNISGVFTPPGTTVQSLSDKPFHVYDNEFLQVIGSNPTLTLIGQTASDPIFHEAVVWSKNTEEVFFVQNAGAPAAGTGLNKSAIVQKISLAQAAAVSGQKNATGKVEITTVDAKPTVINPNGGTNYRGKIVFAGEGQGDNIPSTLFVMDPVAPYNTTVLLNNFFGRQFSSLNDVAVNPRNRDLYFTDVLYGFWQNFRPAPGLPNQVYRYDDSTGAVTVVADGFDAPNGLVFSPDGMHAYVTDTGLNHGVLGSNLSRPATMHPLRYQGERLLWRWRRRPCLEPLGQANRQNLPWDRGGQLCLCWEGKDGHLRRDEAVLCHARRRGGCCCERDVKARRKLPHWTAQSLEGYP
ncbi:hypothetical protein RB595_009418 [Gaeumannomyces hyphopodioides]